PLYSLSDIPSPSPSFSFPAPSPPALYTLSLHDALPISNPQARQIADSPPQHPADRGADRHEADSGQSFHHGKLLDISGHFIRHRSEEHTSELQSLRHLVCRLLLEKKKQIRLLNSKASHY